MEFSLLLSCHFPDTSQPAARMDGQMPEMAQARAWSRESRRSTKPDPARHRSDPAGMAQDDAALTRDLRARSRCAVITAAPRSASRRRTASKISRCCAL